MRICILMIIIAAGMLLLTGCEGQVPIAEKNTIDVILTGDWDATVKNAKLWTQQEPDYPVPHFLLSLGYNYTDQRDKQRAELRIAFRDSHSVQVIKKWSGRVAESNSGNAYAQWIDGVIYEELEQIPSAISSYEKAAAIDPAFYLAQQSLGTLYLSSRRFDDALRCYERVVKLKPYYSGGYLNVASVYIFKKDMDTAIEFMKKAVELAPNDLTANYNLGMAYYQKRMHEYARQRFKKVAEIDPNGSAGADARRILTQLGR